MKYPLVFISVLFLIGCEQQANKQHNNAVETYQNLSDSIDTHMKALTELKQFNGAILVEKEGEVLLKKAYNLKNDSIESLRVTVDSQFDLRSVAKLIAKACLVKLESEGLIFDTMTIDKIYPQFPRGSEITINQLMHHESGLGRELTGFNGTMIELSPQEVVDLIHKEELEFDPGTDVRYSNLGFQLIYYMIAKLSNQTFPDFVRTQFFDPLEMDRSGSHFLDAENKLTNYANGHTVKDGKMIPILALEAEDMQNGHFYSTVTDMHRLLKYLSANKLFHKMAEDGIITHAGGSRGKRAWVYSDLKKDYQIVFLANYDEIPFSDLTKGLIDIMEGIPVEIPAKVDRKAVKLPQSQLALYEGTYDFVDADHITLTFKVENGAFNAYQKGELAGELKAENDSTFFWDASSKESVVFRKEANDTIYALMDFQGVRWKGIPIVE
jgi:CubicO group peptidase (beta-lactamase class C family)